MNIVLQKNVAALGALIRATVAASATAGGSGDATTVTGVTIDRFNSTGGLAQSAEFGVPYEATLASGATLSIGYAVQDSADGSTWADYQTATYAVVATGPSGGGAVAGLLSIPCDLSSARRYTRLNFIPNLSAANTDTANARGVGFLAGFDRLPA